MLHAYLRVAPEALLQAGVELARTERVMLFLA